MLPSMYAKLGLEALAASYTGGLLCASSQLVRLWEVPLASSRHNYATQSYQACYKWYSQIANPKQETMQRQVELVWDNSTHTFVERRSPTASYLQVPTKQPLAHPSLQIHHLSAEEPPQDYTLTNPVYPKDYVEQIAPRHFYPQGILDRSALFSINLVRRTFDWVTGYGPNMTEALWLRRIIFLETVAGVPGMVGGMLRHLRSLRDMKRDHGWIHTLLEEAENERMHLLTFLQLRQPGLFFRLAVLGAQGVFFNFYFIAYIISPRWCHRLVGYLEEEAVKTYTHCLHDIDTGRLPRWANKQVPEIAVQYWKLPPDAKVRDLILAVRADEQCHSHVNHTFGSMDQDDTNPFGKGSHVVP